jgi:hypothetical protein
VLAAAAISSGAYAIHKRWLVEPQVPPDPMASTSPFAEPSTQVAQVNDPPSEPGAAPPIDAGAVAVAPPVRPSNPGNTPPPAIVDAGPVVEPPTEITVNTLVGSQWRMPPNGAWQDVNGTTFKVPITEPTKIEVRNKCCEDVAVDLVKSKSTTTAPLQFRPATIKLRCSVKNAGVLVEWKSSGKTESRNPSPNGEVKVLFGRDATSSTNTVTIEFNNGERLDKHERTVQAGETIEVACKL